MPGMNENAMSFQAEIDAYTEKVKEGQREAPLSKEQLRQIEEKLEQSGYRCPQTAAGYNLRGGQYGSLLAPYTKCPPTSPNSPCSPHLR